ncbi:uncharacterized protein LOC143342380 [Colletes latitarsis]|uniref:uncharacterized protein LOC143342380 n=1 Tax=Colletes latitarsis TaxID=2605962 RepID=UPI00403694FC
MKTRVKNVSDRKRSSNATEKDQKNGKKPFNKKNYRAQKYSNKYKIDQWQERRKKAILRDYYKEVDKSRRQNLKKPVSLEDSNQNEKDKMQPKKVSPFHKAKKEFLRKKDDKRKKQEQMEHIKSEQKEALKKYKEKKMQTFRKLSMRTKKGQPVMKGRLELLLEKIQQQVSN